VDIFIDPDSSTGLADQIYEEVRSGILDGRLGPGDRVPSSRELADVLGVSRHTVTRAFNRLTGEGFLVGRRGGGTVVSDLFTADSNPGPSHPVLQPARPQPTPPTYDLRPSLPDRDLFPLREWKRYARLAVDLHSGWYEDPAGLPELRLVLARWIGRSRGVDASFRQIVVTSGAQQAFFLIAKACLEPGSRVAMEDPGYIWFRSAMEAAGVEVVSVPVDDEGIVVADIPRDVAAVYVTPSHQFPTGVVMSMARRLDLLALARESDMLVLEDDYDSEFRYVDRPLEPIHRLDNGDSVAYIATMSKVLSPSLRLGYVVVPPEYLIRLVEFRQRMDLGPRGLDQQTLRHYIADGHLSRHIRKAHRIYQRRHDKVARHFSRLTEIGLVDNPRANAGLHASAPLSPGLDERQILADLAARGFAIDGYSDYQHDPDGPAGLLVGFGSIDEQRLDEALLIIEETLISAST
jgi:GntR family transcriptional regulator/MocR family aminotransferase